MENKEEEENKKEKEEKEDEGEKEAVEWVELTSIEPFPGACAEWLQLSPSPYLYDLVRRTAW